MARSLGYGGTARLARELAAVRARVSARFASLGREPTSEDVSFERLAAALDAGDEPAVAAAAAERFGPAAAADLPRHLMALARRPDGPLGATTRDRDAAFARLLVDGLAGAADPEQAARLLSAFFARFATPSVYVRGLAEDPRMVRALTSLLGASAFLGESLVGHPDLADRVLFARGAPTPAVARAQLDEEVVQLGEQATDVDAFVGALRRAKRRVTFEVGLADLAGELSTRETAHVLTALADATLDHACRFAMRERGMGDERGLALVAMGKLGGREIGYGSDLDLFFVYEPEAAAGPAGSPRTRPSAARVSPSACCASSARRTARGPATSSTPACARRAARGSSSCRSRRSRATSRSRRRHGSGRRSSRRARARATTRWAPASSSSRRAPRTSGARPIRSA